MELVEFLRDHGFVCGPAHRQVCYTMPRSNGRRCYTDLFCGLSSKAFAQPGWVDRLTGLAARACDAPRLLLSQSDGR